MAKRRRKQDDDLTGGLILLGVIVVAVGGIGGLLLRVLTGGVIGLAVVVYAILGALALDAVLWVYAKSQGETRPFTATRWVFRVLLYPYRLWRRLAEWWNPPIRAETIGELLAMTPAQFEEAVATLLRDQGYTRVERVGKAGDLGVDLTGRDQEGRSVAVQCKRYVPGSRVGSKDLQLFIGMTTVHHRVDRGIYVTTSTYTQPAIDLAHQHNITLIDGARLSRLLPNGPATRADPAPEAPAAFATAERTAALTGEGGTPNGSPARPSRRRQNEAILGELEVPRLRPPENGVDGSRLP